MAYVQKLSFRLLQNAKFSSSNLSSMSSQSNWTLIKNNVQPQSVSFQERKVSNVQNVTIQIPSKQFSTEIFDGHVENAKKTKKPMKVKSKLPMSLRSLLERRPKDSKFPKLHRLAKLSREFSYAGDCVFQTFRALINYLFQLSLINISIINYDIIRKEQSL